MMHGNKSGLACAVPLAELAAGEVSRHLQAGAGERSGLVARFGLESLDSFTADVAAGRNSQGEIVVSGRICARVGQICVVTLEPFVSEIDEHFTHRFTIMAQTQAAPVIIEAGAGEPAEPLEGNVLAGEVVELGEIAVQELSLALDPYPCAPGADLGRLASEAPHGEAIHGEATHGERSQDVGSAESAAGGPFAALADLREKLKDQA